MDLQFPHAAAPAFGGSALLLPGLFGPLYAHGVVNVIDAGRMVCFLFLQAPGGTLQLQYAVEEEEGSSSEDEDEEMEDAPLAGAADTSPEESKGLGARNDADGRPPVQVHLKVKPGGRCM